MGIRIGSPNWHGDLLNSTRHLGKDFWSRFTPVSQTELKALERQIGRTLPDEFKEFYYRIGHGEFEPGDGFYSPTDIVACLGAPVYFILGSLTPGEEWATDDQHRRLWVSRGTENPKPDSFTDVALTLGGIKLYDLLQFGADGSACYHQLYVGPEPAPFRYCLLTDSGTIEDMASSFSEAVEAIIERHSAASSF
jgi:hypothetical protein